MAVSNYRLWLYLRAIEYEIDDPARPGHAQRHRLLTTLLDATRYPALDLVCLYQERWEIEVAIDEIDTHQRLLPHHCARCSRSA